MACMLIHRLHPGYLTRGREWRHHLARVSSAAWVVGRYLVRGCLWVRVAMKALEDHRWPQKRFAAVGGVDEGALCRLELCVEFLLSFNVQIFSPEKLKDLTISLQKAGQAATMTSRLPASFNLKLGAPKLRREVAA